MHAAAPSDDDRPEGSASPGPQVITLGCRLNLAESEAIRRLAGEAGLSDAIIINSCAVTNEAVRTTRRQIRRARRENPDTRLIVTGCAAQIDPDAFAKMPEVDAVIGNVDKLDAGAWAAQARGGERLRVNDIMSVRENAAHLIDGYGDRARAFMQVQNGCDHRCTFCIIPFGRGPSRSVGVADAVASVRRLVDSGHPEIVLTGVDMTSWGHDLEGAPRLGRLVAAILDAVPELFRLRLSSVDCAEIDDELFDRLTGDARVAPHLHLSLQAGSNMILKRMKRRHAREDAIDLTRHLRAKRPEIAIGADLIAGFPTEDEAMFQDSLRLIDEAGVNYAHVFPFSARADTPAARMPQLSGEVVADRARRLREKATSATEQFLDSLIGTVGEAVIESGGRGRFGNFAPARLGDATLRPGDVALLRATARDGDMLIAESAGA